MDNTEVLNAALQFFTMKELLEDLLTHMNDSTLTRMFGDLVDSLYLAGTTDADKRMPGTAAAIHSHIEMLRIESQRRKEDA